MTRDGQFRARSSASHYNFQHLFKIVITTSNADMGIIATLAAIGMSVGPPLAYADQFAAIVRNKSSAGFSKDVCGVLLVANITRIWYWFGEHYQLEREPRVATRLARFPSS